MAIKTEKTYLSHDGKTTVHALCWAPETGTPLAVLQISHGMMEFSQMTPEPM